MEQLFEKISLSHWLIARHIELAGDICDTLKDKVKNFVLWSFTINESIDVKDVAQLAIFIKGVDKELNKTEELLSLQLVLISFLKFAMLLTSLVWTYPLYALQLMVLEPCPELTLDL